jgi:F0F1-type ATP synthase assembly protein I
MFKKYGQSKEIARAMFLYVSYSILGPLLVIGGAGYLIDKLLNTKFFLLFSIFVSYIVTNVLMFKKIKKINQEIEKNAPIKKDEKEDKNIVSNYDETEDEYNEIWPIKNSDKK